MPTLTPRDELRDVPRIDTSVRRRLRRLAMKISLTLTVQTTMTVKNEDDYEAKRDELIEKLEDLGLSVDIESEDEL